MGTKFVMGGDNGGFMVPNDPKSFTDAVIRLLKDRDLWNEKSRQALELSKAWGMDSMAERMERLYMSIS
jgi:glycosyltransferase involved in cell wall biosynthesis